MTMISSLLSSRWFLGAASAVLVGAGIALVVTPNVGVSSPFGGSSAVLAAIHGRRLGSSAVACSGECRVFTAELDDFRLCPLDPGVQATFAACLTALNTACATTCKSNP